MKLRFPLYAKILGWFLLNLVFVGAAFYLFFRVQFRLGFDSLLAGRAGDRIQALAEVIASELRASPRSEWSELLQRFGNAYRVRFALFRPDGGHAAGEVMNLPSEVAARLTDRRPPNAPLRRINPRQQERRAMRGDGPRELPRDPAGEGPREPIPGPPREPPFGRNPEPEFMNPGPFAKFMVHTRNPGLYWVLVRIPVPDPERQRPMAMTLVAVSDSLRGGGLFIDYVPWLAVGFAVLFVSVLFWVPLVRGITHSVSLMRSATEQIAEGRFDVRVTEARSDEIGALGQAINRMASRLAGFVTGQKRFLGDIAHELCSPIARLEMALGILEQRADERQKAYVEDAREEVRHMSNLVNELLSFSRASLGASAVQLRAVAVRAVVEKAVAREVTESATIEMDVPEDLSVQAEPELLLCALANLIRNALRYAGEAGPICVTAGRVEAGVAITVADSGPGVPVEALGQIFDPFYRLDPARARETGGAGLGLAIVKTCVEACGGTVTARNRQPSGLEVTLTLPAADGAA